MRWLSPSNHGDRDADRKPSRFDSDPTRRQDPDKKELTRSVDVSSPRGRQVVRERIERVLLSWLVRQLGGDNNSIDAQRPFAECGIDSLMAVEMSGQLEYWLHVRLSPVIAWSHPNAEKLEVWLI